MSKPNPRVDSYFNRIDQWQEESKKLRSILLDCDLDEDMKWGKPCYAIDGGNVVIIQGFKAYCALLFFKGLLLKDPEGILEKTGENTRVGRQIRFTDVRDIKTMEKVLAAYIRQAISLEKSGAKVAPPEEKELVLVTELQRKLDLLPDLKKAFESLTPGRQRAYNFFISGAKQSATREARVEKCMDRILVGKGLND